MTSSIAGSRPGVIPVDGNPDRWPRGLTWVLVFVFNIAAWAGLFAFTTGLV